MSNNNYFWQGGRKIHIEQTEHDITLNAPDLAAARTMADEAGVSLERMNPVGAGLIRATVAGDRDRSMAQLRELDNVVHHVYQTPGEPDSKYLITDTFFIKFKPGTSPLAIQELLEAEKLGIKYDDLLIIDSDRFKNNADGPCHTSEERKMFWTDVLKSLKISLETLFYEARKINNINKELNKDRYIENLEERIDQARTKYVED